MNDVVFKCYRYAYMSTDKYILTVCAFSSFFLHPRSDANVAKLCLLAELVCTVTVFLLVILPPKISQIFFDHRAELTGIGSSILRYGHRGACPCVREARLVSRA